MLSEPQETIEAAQALHVDELFNPAAVFRDKDGSYRYARLRDMQTWPPHATAQAMQAHGLVMVACCDPLLNIWKAYTPA